MKKKIIFFLLFFSLSHCGFSPIYNITDKLDYKIIITEKSGDKFINNLILQETYKISNKNATKVYYMKVNTVYEKTIVSKNSKGSPTEYQLKAITNFEIQNKNIKKEISFNEKQNIKNISDIFELKNYENTIKTNFAISIIRNLNLQLLNEE
tara:strand:- start:1091 stop:1546 length:456 start_codon:yes stop_codon:yes gene_type:complete